MTSSARSRSHLTASPPSRLNSPERRRTRVTAPGGACAPRRRTTEGEWRCTGSAAPVGLAGRCPCRGRSGCADRNGWSGLVVLPGIAMAGMTGLLERPRPDTTAGNDVGAVACRRAPHGTVVARGSRR
jgi:hypothetical protein